MISSYSGEYHEAWDFFFAAHCFLRFEQQYINLQRQNTIEPLLSRKIIKPFQSLVMVSEAGSKYIW